VVLVNLLLLWHPELLGYLLEHLWLLVGLEVLLLLELLEDLLEPLSDLGLLELL
jgi:hypothetical protein